MPKTHMASLKLKTRFLSLIAIMGINLFSNFFICGKESKSPINLVTVFCRVFFWKKECSPTTLSEVYLFQKWGYLLSTNCQSLFVFDRLVWRSKLFYRRFYAKMRERLVKSFPLSLKQLFSSLRLSHSILIFKNTEYF